MATNGDREPDIDTGALTSRLRQPDPSPQPQTSDPSFGLRHPTKITTTANINYESEKGKCKQNDEMKII